PAWRPSDAPYPHELPVHLRVAAIGGAAYGGPPDRGQHTRPGGRTGPDRHAGPGPHARPGSPTRPGRPPRPGPHTRPRPPIPPGRAAKPGRAVHDHAPLPSPSARRAPAPPEGGGGGGGGGGGCAGAAHSTNVALVPDAAGETPGAHPMPTSGSVIGVPGDSFDQFNFTDLPFANLDAAHLAQFDTVVLVQVDSQTL